MKAFRQKMWQSKDFERLFWWVQSSLRDPGEPFKSFFAVKQGILLGAGPCPETPLKLLAVNVAKQGFVGWCRGGLGDPFESFMQ